MIAGKLSWLVEPLLKTRKSPPTTLGQDLSTAFLLPLLMLVPGVVGMIFMLLGQVWLLRCEASDPCRVLFMFLDLLAGFMFTMLILFRMLEPVQQKGGKNA
jgi:hypothetical protein